MREVNNYHKLYLGKVMHLNDLVKFMCSQLFMMKVNSRLAKKTVALTKSWRFLNGKSYRV